jgi:hypothetical protein
MNVEYCFLLLPAVVLTAAYVIKPVPLLKWICIFVLVVTHGVIGFLKNEIESRANGNQRIRENRLSKDYVDGAKEMLDLSRQAFALSWVPVLGLTVVVLFTRRAKSN